MSIDPTIALQTQLPQQQNPLATFGALASIEQRNALMQDRALKAQQYQRALEDDNAVRQSLQTANGNPDAALDDLYRQGRATAADKFATAIYSQRKSQAEVLDKGIDTQKKQFGFAAQLFQSTHDQASWDTAYNAAQSVLPKPVLAYIPKTFDPAKKQEIVDWGTTIGEHLKAQQDAIGNYQKAIELSLQTGKSLDERAKNQIEARKYWGTAAGSLLSTSTSQDDWDNHQRLLLHGGAPPDLLAQFGNQYSPAAAKKALQIGQTPAELATNAYRTQDLNLRGQEVNLRQRELDDKEEANGTSGKPMTDNQRRQVLQKKASDFTNIERDFAKQWRTGAGPTGWNPDIPPEALAEFGRRKLEIENAARTQLGQMPLEDAERYYAQQGPAAAKDLQKVRNTYRAVTGQQAPILRMQNLAQQIKAETDPAKAAALKQQLQDLYSQYHGGAAAAAGGGQ